MKPGDRFRFTAEGVVTTAHVGGRAVLVVFDGHGPIDVSPNTFDAEWFAAHAELIPPPYVPQVGDIVRDRDGLVREVDSINGSGASVLCADGIRLYPDDLALVARPGEVYQP